MAKQKYKTREGWLHVCLHRYARKYFREHGYILPDKIRIGVGFTSGGARSQKVEAEVGPPEYSTDGTIEITISLIADGGVRVIGALLHELAHIAAGIKHGHKTPFVKCCKQLGLTDGNPTSAGPGSELTTRIEQWIKKLGPYPHAKIKQSRPNKKKQSTRMLKLECQECGCVVRTANKWMEQYGEAWDCPCGGVLER